MKRFISAGLTLTATTLVAGLPAQGSFGRSVVMRALDADGDGVLSAKEIAGASAALALLDEDGDGSLSGLELGRTSRWRMDDWGDDMKSFGNRRRNKPGDRKRLDPEDVPLEDGAATIPGRETFRKMAYEEGMVMPHHKGLEFVKFQIVDAKSSNPKLYFINTRKHSTHVEFMQAIGGGRSWADGMRGTLVFRPRLKAPGGKSGLYTFEFETEDTYSFEQVLMAWRLLQSRSELFRGKLAWHIWPRAVASYQQEKQRYDEVDMRVVQAKDMYADIGFLPLHVGESFGRLRVMAAGDQPGPRDIVICSTLPNEMPRVAGVLTTFRQTPLSHVNLRAVQDDIPNAFVHGASDDEAVRALVGSYVFYRVALEGFQLRAASSEEVHAHFADLRPKQPRVPERDLSVETIRSLDSITRSDSASVGAKAANLAMMRTFELEEGVIPTGFAIPFHFYDAYMRHNGFYDKALAMRKGATFGADAKTRAERLRAFRKLIKLGKVPPWMNDALSKLQQSFPAGASIRCRSSTNNEDLPGFSGAGLYDSFTHHPNEGHLSKSVRQVFASLWNFRAFEEREFFRVDHSKTAMGVLVHANYVNEQVNGVAVTQDILYQTHERSGRSYLVNAQVGEDLVTNPGAASIPMERLLHSRFPAADVMVRSSNQLGAGQHMLTPAQVYQLRMSLKTIHREFRELYGKKSDESFAMEVEFKITSAGKLVIKQSRPWVFR